MKEKNDIFEGKTYDYQTIVSNYDVQVGLKTIKNAGGGAQKTNYEIEMGYFDNCACFVLASWFIDNHAPWWRNIQLLKSSNPNTSSLNETKLSIATKKNDIAYLNVYIMTNMLNIRFTSIFSTYFRCLCIVNEKPRVINMK